MILKIFSAIIGDQKRIKLLMQVFKINNAKTETVAMKKLEVWWYFVKKLDTKILSNFDMVSFFLLALLLIYMGVFSNYHL